MIEEQSYAATLNAEATHEPNEKLQPTSDFIDYARRYAREKPGVVAIVCVGLGFILAFTLRDDLESVACRNNKYLRYGRLLGKVLHQLTCRLLGEGDPLSDFNRSGVMRNAGDDDHTTPPSRGRST